MSQVCDEQCFPTCDFCYYYDFNPNKGGGYQSLGYCRYHKEGREPGDDCSEFICFAVKEKEEIRNNNWKPNPEDKRQ